MFPFRLLFSVFLAVSDTILGATPVVILPALTFVPPSPLPSSPSRSRFLLYTLRSHPYVPIFCPPTLSPVSARNNPVLSAILNQRCFIIPHHDSIRTYTSADFSFRLRSSQPSVQLLFGPLSSFVFFACSHTSHARMHACTLKC
ncbi:hypothetical protein HETIRDRAFT_472104 [Heterobasidion irregulare TC 32-1]|uniref:Secreted protein n=1 Tax=Heterobasidion irregulare (strain TC 32-1) TaxID=747525 RepID=W4KD88_HETIT|nr:uncharacterized protein HETIRDRAFT_472104 [Heterobasidion irregulare TC 32-1]ETW83797.1 hypothetical protein HETIRDRAFT_472104 [Heterobasidion irregulare TC 32-1]